jgi:PPOX class probable F420-dependent enzyme
MPPLTQSQARFLATARVARLATADESGRPHVIPVCFVFADLGYGGAAIYIVLDQKPKSVELTRLRRVRNILANPQVSLVIDHYDEDWTRLWYLLVQGRAELIESGAEPADAVSLLRSKYPQYRKMDLDGNPVIKITPERATGWSGG